MAEIWQFISEYKCFSIYSERICSRCRRNLDPAFYRYDDTRSRYICDDCHTICYWNFGWKEEELKDTPKISDKIVKIVSERGYY